MVDPAFVLPLRLFGDGAESQSPFALKWGHLSVALHLKTKYIYIYTSLPIYLLCLLPLVYTFNGLIGSYIFVYTYMYLHLYMHGGNVRLRSSKFVANTKKPKK